MRKWYRQWRDRRWWNSLNSQAVALEGRRFRVTARHGKIIGIEMWTPSEHREITVWDYQAWRA